MTYNKDLSFSEQVVCSESLKRYLSSRWDLNLQPSDFQTGVLFRFPVWKSEDCGFKSCL